MLKGLSSVKSAQYSEPDNLTAVRQLIRDPGRSPEERFKAYNSITGYRDGSSVSDVASFLEVSEWDLLALGARELASIGEAEAAIVITKRLLQLIDETPFPAEAVELLVSKLQVRYAGIIEAYSRDLILKRIGVLSHDDPKLISLLNSLKGLPLSVEAVRIVEIIDQSRNILIQLAAASAIGNCTRQEVVDRCLENARTTKKIKLRERLLDGLSRGSHRLHHQFDWLFENLLDAGLHPEKRMVILSLLQNAEISADQKARLEEFIIDQANALGAGSAAAIGLLSKECVSRLSQHHRMTAAHHFLECVVTASHGRNVRSYACLLLGYCGADLHAAPLAKLLESHWSTEEPDADIDRLAHSLIETILRLNPHALIQKLRDRNWEDLTQGFSRLARWSENHKVLVSEDFVVTKDGLS